MASLAIVYAGVLVLGPLFAWIERRAPERAIATRWRGIDLAYWLVVTPIVTGTFTRAATLGAIGVLSRAWSATPDGLLGSVRAASPVSTLTLPLQLALALLLADLIGYFSHRVRHRGIFWSFHAIHHSASELDALAAARMHPIDDAIDNVLVGGAIMLAGFDEMVLIVLGPFLLLHTMLTHANVRWDFGPLRYLFVSPAHHRGLHALDRAAARGCNYAGMFSLFDLAFGTYYLPRDRAPEAFGSGEAIDERVLAQLTWPFAAMVRRARRRR